MAASVMSSSDSSCFNPNVTVSPDFPFNIYPINQIVQCTSTRLWWNPDQVQGCALLSVSSISIVCLKCFNPTAHHPSRVSFLVDSHSQFPKDRSHRCLTKVPGSAGYHPSARAVLSSSWPETIADLVRVEVASIPLHKEYIPTAHV